MKSSLLAPLLLSSFKEQVKAVTARSETIRHFTPHGISHIQGVEQSVDYLLSFQSATGALSEQVGPTPLERCLLSFCAWGHDLGMIQEVAEEFRIARRRIDERKSVQIDQLRKDHDIASAYYIQKKIPSILNQILENIQLRVENAKSDCERRLREEVGNWVFDGEDSAIDLEIARFMSSFCEKQNADRYKADAANLAHTINLIARYHRRAESIETCPNERYLFGERIRSKFLAAVFRLADALHIDRTRFAKGDFDLYRALPQFSEENRVHWIKSAIISSIRIDPERHTVHIQADLPTENRPESGAQEMLNFIRSDVEEDLLSVSGILLKNSFPALLGVTYEIHRIPEIDYSSDIRSALDSILAAASPNTSKLVKIALEALEVILSDVRKTSGKVGAKDLLERSVQDQCGAVLEQLRQRPCHEALHKIKDLLEAVDGAWKLAIGAQLREKLAKSLDADEMFYTLIEAATRVFVEQRQRVEAGSRSDRFAGLLASYSDVVVYGYSHQVLRILEAHFVNCREAEQCIHVLECRTKTQYSSAGTLLYLDGQRYAERIALTVSRYKELSIEPDVALGHIIQESIKKGSKTVVLMGTNAVYTNGTIVHSMGHLSVAAIAKALHWSGKCDVLVVTDGMKIGQHERSNTEERNPDSWLTPDQEVRRRLRRQGIVMRNWQEDLVPASFIDKLIILDRREILEPPFDNLAQSEFKARYVFCARLARSFLAAIIGRTDKAEHSKRIEAVLPGVKGHDLDWELAGLYLDFLDNSGKRPRAGEETRTINSDLARWLAQMWTAERQEAVRQVCHSICPTGEFAEENGLRGMAATSDLTPVLPAHA